MCNVEAKDSLSFKKHMRDVHNVSYVSTSPPLKRKRKLPDVNKDDSMDVVINNSDEKSSEAEEMDIDEAVMLSNRMDKKIKEKAKKTRRERNK